MSPLSFSKETIPILPFYLKIQRRSLSPFFGKRKRPYLQTS
jgi:hypothetical protein